MAEISIVKDWRGGIANSRTKHERKDQFPIQYAPLIIFNRFLILPHSCSPGDKMVNLSMMN